MLLQLLSKHERISPPKWLISNTQYLTVVGSDTFGVSSGASDVDVYGVVIPPKYLVFPHLGGAIPGFGEQQPQFNVWQQHHIQHDGKSYDVAVYGIIKYFQLCMDNNPNMIDSLFTPRRCVLHSTAIGEHIRTHRREFLHKGAWHRYKGYAYQQMSKLSNRTDTASVVMLRQFERDHGISHDTTHAEVVAEKARRARSGDGDGPLSGLPDQAIDEYASRYQRLMDDNRRLEGVKRFLFDPKFAYHVVRLLCQIEQIMVEGDLDLERNREQLKAIRRGEWSVDQLQTYFTEKERALETIYASSNLPHRPDEARIKAILMSCLEMHYGNLDAAVTRDPTFDRLLDDLRELVARHDR